MTGPYHPPHIYQSNTIYFVTGKAKGNIFNASERCRIFFDVLGNGLKRFRYEGFGWVLNPDYYHILIKVSDGRMLGRFINNLHSNTARLVNILDNTGGRQIWYQYWDRCIRSEKDLYTRLNYIHHNPVKHGLVIGMGDYEWSSYRRYLDERGAGWLMDCFERYPICDFTLEEGD